VLPTQQQKPVSPSFNLLQPSGPPSLLTPTVKPVQPAVPEMREFGDNKTTRQFIYDSTMNAAKSVEPIEDDNYSLKLTNVDWADPDRFTRKRRKQAILAGETLARRMKGTWELYDKRTGKLIEQRNQIVGAVPYLSSMGTFTHRGNEYIMK